MPHIVIQEISQDRRIVQRLGIRGILYPYTPHVLIAPDLSPEGDCFKDVFFDVIQPYIDRVLKSSDSIRQHNIQDENGPMIIMTDESPNSTLKPYTNMQKTLKTVGLTSLLIPRNY